MNNTLIKEIETNLKQLASETDNVKKSEFFKNYLETISKFWKYSYHNQLLIHYKMPTATKVAGFRKWQELNRNVKKGSKAIKILAPCIKKIKDIDPRTMKEVEKAITLFFPVNVFDISQTEGEPLPEIEITIKGDNYKDFLEILVNFCKEKQIKVDFKNLGINGLYGYSKGGQIAITNTESINTQVNTIIHEIAHELLHGDSKLSKQQKEIQAEGTAYVVMKHFNIENKSFNYLALYDADYKKIMENLKVIAEASKEIIEFVSAELFG
ncbi:ArdC-like ssDNA-binding domain-containing protein [Nanoarchaeota archaeon]